MDLVGCPGCGHRFSPTAGACPQCGRPLGPPPPGQAMHQAGNGLAIAGMVVGIVGLVFSWFPFLGAALCVVGVVLSVAGMSRARQVAKRGQGMAIAGLVCSIVGLVLGIVIMVGIFTFERKLEQHRDEARRDLISAHERMEEAKREAMQLQEEIDKATAEVDAASEALASATTEGERTAAQVRLDAARARLDALRRGDSRTPDRTLEPDRK